MWTIESFKRARFSLLLLLLFFRAKRAFYAIYVPTSQNLPVHRTLLSVLILSNMFLHPSYVNAAFNPKTQPNSKQTTRVFYALIMAHPSSSSYTHYLSRELMYDLSRRIISSPSLPPLFLSLSLFLQRLNDIPFRIESAWSKHKIHHTCELNLNWIAR